MPEIPPRMRRKLVWQTMLVQRSTLQNISSARLGPFSQFSEHMRELFRSRVSTDSERHKQKWKLVFCSLKLKFRNYMHRRWQVLCAGQGWKMFHPDHVVVTNNVEWGKNPMTIYRVLRNNGDTHWEALLFLCGMYRISRFSLPTTPGASVAPFEVRHCRPTRSPEDASHGPNAVIFTRTRFTISAQVSLRCHQ